jgi:hypothetical protein
MAESAKPESRSKDARTGRSGEGRTRRRQPVPLPSTETSGLDLLEVMLDLDPGMLVWTPDLDAKEAARPLSGWTDARALKGPAVEVPFSLLDEDRR